MGRRWESISSSGDPVNLGLAGLHFGFYSALCIRFTFVLHINSAGIPPPVLFALQRVPFKAHVQSIAVCHLTRPLTVSLRSPSVSICHAALTLAVPYYQMEMKPKNAEIGDQACCAVVLAWGTCISHLRLE